MDVDRAAAEAARAALPAWGIGPDAPVVLVNRSENSTFRVDDPATGESFALRLHRDGYHTRAGIDSELAWMTALRRDGVALTPEPVPGKDGALVQAAAMPGGAPPRHVVLFRWEAGEEPRETGDLAPLFATLGGLAAKLHGHSAGWVRPAGFLRHRWDIRTMLGAQPHWGRWQGGIGVAGAASAVLGRATETVERRLRAFGTGPDRFGLIHGDMRLANLLVDGATVKLLDFDDCGFGWHLYDAAAAVSFFEDAPEVPDLLDAWVAGYRTVRPLADADAAELPTFVMLRRLVLVAWLGSHADTDLAGSLGAPYTEASASLAESYLRRFA